MQRLPSISRPINEGSQWRGVKLQRPGRYELMSAEGTDDQTLAGVDDRRGELRIHAARVVVRRVMEAVRAENAVHPARQGPSDTPPRARKCRQMRCAPP